MAASHIFKVVFVNQGKVYEIYARKVSHGSLFGFIEVEELVFGERSAVVVDPSEEKVKAEFEGVKRTYLPLHSVLRIDEVRTAGRQQDQHVRRLERHAVSGADVHARGQEIGGLRPVRPIIRALLAPDRAGSRPIGSTDADTARRACTLRFPNNQTPCRRHARGHAVESAQRALRPLCAVASRPRAPTSGAS